MASESNLLNLFPSNPGDLKQQQHLLTSRRKERPASLARPSASSNKLSVNQGEEEVFLPEELSAPTRLRSPRSSSPVKSPKKTRLPKVGGFEAGGGMKYNPEGGSNLRKTGAGRTVPKSPTKRRLPLIRTSKASSLEESPDQPLR